jgi:DNA-binding NtrC family response regulator
LGSDGHKPNDFRSHPCLARRCVRFCSELHTLPGTLCLKDEGYDVTAVSSGTAARRVLAQGGVDIVVTDSLMGGGGSDDIAKKAQAAGLPVILIGGTQREDRSLPFLIKPFPSELLMATIDRLLTASASMH